MASTPRSTIEDSYVSGMHCAICGAETLAVGHAGQLPDYVACGTCSSAFLVEQGGERIFYGQIGAGFPEAQAFALRQWAFPEAVEKVARPERPTLPEIEPAPEIPPEPEIPAAVEPEPSIEPVPETPVAEQTPEPEPDQPEQTEPESPESPADEGDSSFASEFGFLEELAESGPSSEPPGETFGGLVDSDEPHEADLLTPPPWARIEPEPELELAAPAEGEPVAPEPFSIEDTPPMDEVPADEIEAAPPAEEEPLPVWTTFEEPAQEVKEPELPQPITPAAISDEDQASEDDGFRFKDDDIPGEPVQPEQFDDPLGLASAFESISVDPEPSAPEQPLADEPDETPAFEAQEEPVSPVQETESEQDWMAGMRELQPEEPEPEAEPGAPILAEEPESDAGWLSGMTALPRDDEAATIESHSSTRIDTTPMEDVTAQEDWLASMAAEPDEDDPTTIESSGSRAVQAEAADEDVGWLAAMAETPLDENSTSEVDEPQVDWLSEIDDDAAGDAQPAAPEHLQPTENEDDAPPGQPAGDENWLASLSEASTDGGSEAQAEVDWLSSIGDTAAGGDEPMHTVTNWLSSREETPDEPVINEDEPDSGIDWLGTSAEGDGEEAEESESDAFAALRSAEPESPEMGEPDEDQEEDDPSYDPFDFNQRIASLKADAKQEQPSELEDDDFLSGLRRSAAIPLESEPLDNTPLASVNLDSQPFIKTEDEAESDEGTDEDPLAMAARMGAIGAGAEAANLPEWMEEIEEEAEPRPVVGAFKLRDTDPPTGQRYRVVLRGDRVVFPSGDCAHCGRTPVKGRLAVYGTLPKGQKVGQRTTTTFNVPLCAECRARAAQLTEDAGNARLQAHLISGIIGMVLVVLALVIGIIDPKALALPDLMILAILLIVGYAGPVTFLLNRVGSYPPPPDAVYVRTTLIVPSETQGLETAFEWRNAEYAQRFFDANQAVSLGKMISVKDRLGTPES